MAKNTNKKSETTTTTDAAAAAESNGNGRANNGYRQRMRQLPAHKRQAVLIGNIIDRVQKIADDVHNWDEDVTASAKAALGSLDNFKDTLLGLSDDFEPPKKSRKPRGELKAGAFVDLNEKGQERYGALLDKEDFVGAEVLGTSKGVVEVRFQSGREGFINRGLVKAAKEETASA